MPSSWDACNSSPGLGLRHSHSSLLVVKAGKNRIELQFALEPLVDAVNQLLGAGAAGDIGLIRDHHQAVAVRVQRAQRLGYARQNLQLRE